MKPLSVVPDRRMPAHYDSPLPGKREFSVRMKSCRSSSFVRPGFQGLAPESFSGTPQHGGLPVYTYLWRSGEGEFCPAPPIGMVRRHGETRKSTEPWNTGARRARICRESRLIAAEPGVSGRLIFIILHLSSQCGIRSFHYLAQLTGVW